MTQQQTRQLARVEERIERALSLSQNTLGLGSKQVNILEDHIAELSRYKRDFEALEDDWMEVWIESLEQPEAETKIIHNRSLHKLMDTELRKLNAAISDLIANNTTPSTSVQHTQDDVRLPKIELISFSGDKASWETFWASFNAHVHANKRIPEVSKYNYLSAYLKGQPREILNNFQPTVEGYKDAIKELLKCYSDAEAQLESVLDRFFDLKPPENQHSSLFSYRVKVQGVLNDMEHQGINLGANEQIIRRHVVRTTPSYIMQNVYSITGNRPSLAAILKAFEDIVTRGKDKPKASSSKGGSQSDTSTRPSEVSSSLSGGRGHNGWRGGHNGSSRGRGGPPRGRGGHGSNHYEFPSAAVMFSAATEKYPCIFCEQSGHNPRDCQNVPTVRARQKALARKELCQRCLHKHDAKQPCPKLLDCYRCGGGDHHSWLCIPQGGGGGNKPSSS